MSSRGEMKMSLKLMIWGKMSGGGGGKSVYAYVFVLYVLEELELAVCAL